MHLGLALKGIQEAEGFIRSLGPNMTFLSNLAASIENTRRGGAPPEDLEIQIRDIELSIRNIYYWLKAASEYVPGGKTEEPK